MYLMITLKLLSYFSLYVWNSAFLPLSSFTMFTYAMELFGWILICPFMIFILYLLTAISFNSCESDEKLSTLAIRMGGSLTVFSIHFGAYVVELFLKSFEGVGNRHRFTWLMPVHFGCFRGIRYYVITLYVIITRRNNNVRSDFSFYR